MWNDLGTMGMWALFTVGIGIASVGALFYACAFVEGILERKRVHCAITEFVARMEELEKRNEGK